MRKIQYSIGDKWNRLTFVEDVPSELRGNDKRKRRRCLFKCDCGNDLVATLYSVKVGKTQSCGCLVEEGATYLVGDKWGRLELLEEVDSVFYANSNDRRRRGLFVCDCGNLHEALLDSVKRGNTKSCGCLNQETRSETGKLRKTHGMSASHLHNTWTRMKQRCSNPNNPSYKDYGARGIGIDDLWYNSFESFYEDMYSTYEDGLELDRINVNKNYCKANCRWATESVQAYNQRRYKSNTSGRTGVSWNKKCNKWEARISFQGLEISLGLKSDFEDAVALREQAEMKYYGYIKELAKMEN